MNRSFFYSWQSDLPAQLNRNLILDALERSAKAITRDERQWVRPVIDRDTSGLIGTPAIADSILAKIASSDAFVADVSLVNGGSARLTPNPNVLVELGYAVGKLGWDRVILVQNTAFGAPDDLPFDLRGRRIVTYHAPEGVDKSAVRTQLQHRLTPAINAIANSQGVGVMPTGIEASVWRGTWTMGAEGGARRGILKVLDVCASGFFFELNVANGAHIGEISGFAALAGTDAAYARIENGHDNEDGEISFHRSNASGRRTVRLEETASCINWHGMRADFSGEFLLERLPWLDAGLINEIELGKMQTLLGSNFKSFCDATGEITVEDVSESGIVKAFAGGLAGLYTMVETIAVFGEDSKLWCAHLNGDEQLFYAASHEKTPMPGVIEEWRERFKDTKIVSYPGGQS